MHTTTTLAPYPDRFNQMLTMTMASVELVDFVNAHRKEQAEAAGASFPSKGHAKLDHADLMKKALEVLGEHAGNFSCMFNVTVGNGAVRKSPGYRFPKREACLMAMSYSYELQAKVFDRMTALEAKRAFALPDFTNQAAAARAWADAIEASQILAIERDHAIATKAQIGNRREATAMGTASAARKESVKLRALMGEASKSASIIAVQVKTGITYNWRDLKKYCTAAGLSMGKSFNPGLQLNVNTYPAQAWFEAYGVDLVELFGAEVQQ